MSSLALVLCLSLASEESDLLPATSTPLSCPCRIGQILEAGGKAFTAGPDSFALVKRPMGQAVALVAYAPKGERWHLVDSALIPTWDGHARLATRTLPSPGLSLETIGDEGTGTLQTIRSGLGLVGGRTNHSAANTGEPGPERLTRLDALTDSYRSRDLGQGRSLRCRWLPEPSIRHRRLGCRAEIDSLGHRRHESWWATVDPVSRSVLQVEPARCRTLAQWVVERHLALAPLAWRDALPGEPAPGLGALDSLLGR